jgi:hypothetical protein
MGNAKQPGRDVATRYFSSFALDYHRAFEGTQPPTSNS